MHEVLEFMGQHPVASFFLALVAGETIIRVLHIPYLIINRVMRHINIANHGYPPTHCDADGDFKPEPETKE